MDELKMGTLVGVDKFGNKYYENNEYFHGRNRWVEYSDDVYLDYDGSQIPPEWHIWMHYSTDIPPTKQEPVRHKWMIDHSPNMTGTPLQYVPYSTTRQKIQSFQPNQQQLQNESQKKLK
jgi:NADH:ubiquinone oxidoreductase subunit